MKKESLTPQLAQGQRSVLFAEVNTGILLTPEGERHAGQAKCYRVFDSEEHAMTFARAYVDQHPEVECCLRDENGNYIRFIRKQS